MQGQDDYLWITALPDPEKIDRTICGFCGSKNIVTTGEKDICKCVKCKDCLRTESTWCEYQ